MAAGSWPQLQAFLTGPAQRRRIIHGLAFATWVLWAMATVAVLAEAVAFAYRLIKRFRPVLTGRSQLDRGRLFDHSSERELLQPGHRLGAWDAHNAAKFP